ncbi:MAG: hypothetical protein KF834_11000 [Burkholderiales bacterium]|nr:hypothetical protein [Burkholderiales bacterium]
MAALNIDRKKAVMGVVGAGVLGFAAYLAWDMFMAEPPPPPPPPPKAVAKPKPPADVSPDKVVDDIITAAGLRKFIDQIPEKVMMGARQSAAKPRDPAVVAEVEKVMTAVFRPERFHLRVRDALRKDFDRKRMEGLLKVLNSPLVRKMTELEGQDVKPEELMAFAKAQAAKPLPGERLQLLQDFDQVTRATDFAVELVVGTTRAMVSGAVSGDKSKLADFDRSFGAQREKLVAALRNATQLTFAYIYRDVSDADLAEYSKFYAGEDGKWFMERVSGALLEEFRAAAQEAGEKLAEAAKAKKQDATATKPAMKGSGTVPQADSAAAETGSSGARPLTSRSRLDARECLKHDSNPAIHRCAEGYR